MKPKNARKLIVFLWGIGFLIILCSYVNILFLPVGIILAGSSVIPSVLFYKCPHCGRHLGRNGGDFCPYCGKCIDG